jgi:hypothetical protein
MIRNLFIESYAVQLSIHGNKLLAVIGSLLLITLLQFLNIVSFILGLQTMINAHLRRFFFYNTQGRLVLIGAAAGFFLLNFLFIQPLSEITNREEVTPKKHFLVLYGIASIAIFAALIFIT